MLAAELHSLNATHDSKSEVEGNVKLENRVRMQGAIVGLGAALLMTGSARAQQDMNPTSFDVRPGTPGVSKILVVKAAHSSQAAKENVSAESALALANRNDATLEAGVTRMAIVDAGIAMILLGGIISIGIYAVAATRRTRVPRVSSMTGPYTPVSAASAQ
jgi:hypothetical protein